MINQNNQQGVKPRIFDFSNGSTNPYKVEERHGLIPRCLHCGANSIVTLDGSDYFAYFVSGTKRIEQAFHYLTPPQREVLITGIHPECFEAIFSDEIEAQKPWRP